MNNNTELHIGTTFFSIYHIVHMDRFTLIIKRILYITKTMSPNSA